MKRHHEQMAVLSSSGAGRAAIEERRSVATARSLPAPAALAVALAACSDGGAVVGADTEAGEQSFSNAASPAAWAQTPIVFRSDRGSPGIGDLYLMAPDGSRVRRLTTGGDFYMPQWSPSGDGIACRWVSGERAEVGLLTADGGSPALLTQGEPADYYSRPVQWSPDGQRLGFASSRDGALKVWLTSRSGGAQEPLVVAGESSLDVAWSVPDGSHVAYAAYPTGGPAAAELGARGTRDIWVAPVDGSAEPVNLTRGRVFGPGYLRWSPDGRRIAFSAYALAADGSLEVGGDHAAAGYSPPDDELYVIDVETAELTRLTDNDAVDHVPAWSPDGQALLFTSYRDGDGDVWVLPIDAPEAARNLIDDGELSDQEDHLADWFWGPASMAGASSE